MHLRTIVTSCFFADEQKLSLVPELGLMLTELLPCPEETTADVKHQLPRETQQVGQSKEYNNFCQLNLSHSVL